MITGKAIAKCAEARIKCLEAQVEFYPYEDKAAEFMRESLSSLKTLYAAYTDEAIGLTQNEMAHFECLIFQDASAHMGK